MTKVTKPVPSPPKVIELDLPSIDLDGAISLVVGTLSSGKLKLSQVAISEDVAEDFRAVIDSTVVDLDRREAERWSPEAMVTSETYLTLRVDELGTVPELSRDISSYGTLMNALKSAASLPALDANKIPAAAMSLYAFVVGNDPEQRAVFIRKTNPRRSLRNGRMIFALRDTLVRVEEPLFGFDALIDIAVVGEVVGVISATTFEAIFRNQEAIAALAPQWVSEVEKTLPFNEVGRAYLVKKASSDSRIRTRLDSIVARGHLAKVTPKSLRKAISDAEMNPKDFMTDDGELLVTAENVFDLMHVLNEDLYEGPLSSARFRADRKQLR